MISILIADDDIAKISSIIDAIHLYYKNQVEIKQASNVQEALEVLRDNHFHLLISDLLMPLRATEQPNEKGGEVLIKEIYKKRNKVNTPIYIVGLTQFKEVSHNFTSVWKVWQYNISEEDWKLKLRDLIFHISRIDSKIVKEKKPTLFVEGISDKEILMISFSIFFPQFINKISIETVNYGAGASWIQRQIIIWAKTLFRVDEEYVQALGLFDNDQAGLDAMESVKEQIDKSSAEYNTFSMISFSTNYAKHLIPIYSKGIIIPITIEEMYSSQDWQYAKDKGWLVERKLSDDLLKDPKKWDKTNQSLKQYIEGFTFSHEEKVFIDYKIDENYKINFMNYIKGLSVSEQKKSLSAFEPLIEDVIKKLKL